jgi:Outer membrane protein beta-barrel domain
MVCSVSRSVSGTAMALLTLCLTVLPHRAEAQGWIVGGSVGAAKQQDYSIGVPVPTRDDTDTAMRLFGGYMVTRNQGVIASYVDLGTPNYAGPAFGGFTDSLDGYGGDISYFIGFMPGHQQRASLFGTVGIMRFNQDVTYTDSTGTYTYKDDGTSFTAGFGTEINLGSDGTNAWSLRAEYQLFKDVGETANSGHEYDREMLSVGVAYRFGPSGAN